MIKLKRINHIKKILLLMICLVLMPGCFIAFNFGYMTISDNDTPNTSSTIGDVAADVSAIP